MNDNDSSAEPAIPIEVPTGYGPVRYFANRYRQGGRTVYSIDLSIADVVDQLAKPDPERAIEANRKIRAAHARGFASYLRTRAEWTSPPLLLRAPTDVFRFEPLNIPIEGTDWGYLEIPRHARDELAIVDGQHRILGAHYAWEDLVEEVKSARAKLATAKSHGEIPEVVARLQASLDEALEARRRFETERMTIQIVLENDPKAYKQMFYDIADNAKGITHSVRTRFDSTKIVNRCLEVVMEHPLLENNVDIEQDRILGSNPYLMSAKHVADIIRTLEVGISGRIGRRLESELDESHLERQAAEFFDLMTDAFPEYAAIRDGSLSPVELRQKSLLGSVTIQRVLAGAYHDLTRGENGAPKLKRREVQAFFSQLDMTAPIKPEGPWMATEAFNEPYMSPGARRQEVDSLVKAIVGWAESWEKEGTSAD